MRAYTEKDKDKKKEYYDKNREEILRKKAEHYRKHRETILKKRKAQVRSEEQVKHTREYMEKWRAEHPEAIETYRKSEHAKELRRQHNKQYRQKHKERLRIKDREYVRNRSRTDPAFRTKKQLRTLLYIAFRKYSTTGKIMSSKKYGIDYQAIINHLGPRPAEGFHIDHIILLSMFDFDDPLHVRAAFAPENHQWLSAHDNLSKSGKCDHQMLESYLLKFDGGCD